MIFYFSGTGNTGFVAERLSELTHEVCAKVTDTDPCDVVLSGKSLGFVFPVYSWGVAPVMVDFIRKLPESFWHDVRGMGIAVWGVMTCGDEVALAPEMFSKCLMKHGIEVESIWSVVMPNNYVLLPGFDVDTKDVEQRKLAEAPLRIREIADGIKSRLHKVDVVRGTWPRLKTRLVYPLFKKWGISPGKWHSTPACVGCGICAGACPLRNIAMKDGVPVWGSDCCSCLACYHSCPRHAVAYYGKITFRKGQYRFK